jgi:probable F420-dependent oxidoreductase
MSKRPAIGLATALTHESLQPIELARWLEENGFESLFLGEHSHLPVAAHRYGDGVSLAYRKFYDPFVALTAAAAVTTRLKLGTAVCLVPEHHPIALAKRVATLDQISGGRFLFGVGTGWNTEEIANHGVAWGDRWKVTRERILAMREIWSREQAEFHGEFVDFDPIYCWPKPVQKPWPKILIGGGVKPEVIARRVVEYGDGWIPLDGADHAEFLETTLAAIREGAARAGRAFEEFDLTIGLGLMGPVTEKRFHEVVKLGFRRVLLLPAAGLPPREAWPLLEGFAKLRAALG